MFLNVQNIFQSVLDINEAIKQKIILTLSQ